MYVIAKHIVVYFQIVSYSLIGFAGHIPTTNELTKLFICDEQVSTEKKSYPTKVRPIWTKQKHYPPNTITKVSDQQIPANIPIARNINIVFVFEYKKNIIPLFSYSLFAKPRDPPLS